MGFQPTVDYGKAALNGIPGGLFGVSPATQQEQAMATQAVAGFTKATNPELGLGVDIGIDPNTGMAVGAGIGDDPSSDEGANGGFGAAGGGHGSGSDTSGPSGDPGADPGADPGGDTGGSDAGGSGDYAKGGRVHPRAPGLRGKKPSARPVMTAPPPQMAMPPMMPQQSPQMPPPSPYLVPFDKPQGTLAAIQPQLSALAMLQQQQQGGMPQGQMAPPDPSQAGALATLGGGGPVQGPGDGKSDSIPVPGPNGPSHLSDGEFVMTAPAMATLGRGSNNAGSRQMTTAMQHLEAGRRGAAIEALK